MPYVARSLPAARGVRTARLRACAAGWCLLAGIAISQGASAGTTFTVTSTADSGAGSLRDAIVQANTTVQSAPYTINFNINTATDPGCIGSPKVCTIAPATDLPSIQRQTTIDGFTQPGASPSTAAFGDPTNASIVLVLDGGGSSPGTNGFAMPASVDILIRGFSVVGWHNGFNFTGGGEFGAGQISGNYIGLLPDGLTVKSNTDTGILGNGTGALLVGSPEGPLMPGDRNVISGSTRGIYQTSDFFIQVYGNYVGTDASGTLARPNGDGIVLAQSVAASTSTLAFNVVSGNTNHGYLIASQTADITNTRVGTTAPGTAALPNGFGITFTQGGGDIGKSLASDPGNIVSGNTHDGITFAPGSGGIFNPLVLLYTLVGTDINLNPLGNGGAGVLANGSAIVIGGFGGNPAGSNTIAYNGGDGIDIVDPTASGVEVAINSIYANAGLGISFRPGTGPTPNDPGDTDTGPNGLQNHPVLTSASISAGKATIKGTMNSAPSTSYTLELFANDSCDPSGFGEGKYYLGTWDVATDSSGNGSFVATLPTMVPAGASVFTALATRDSLPFSSSEFSNCMTSGTPPVLQSAASRKVHGGAGTFDLPLGLAVTNPTTEPRQGPAQTIVFTFDKPIIAATPSITEGVATAGTPTFSGNSVIVPLTGVSNKQYVSISLSNVTSSDGGTTTAVVRVGFLLGDVNQNRVVTVSDLVLVNAAIAHVVTPANFLKDVNANGFLTVSDTLIVNNNITKALPAP